MNQDTQTDFDSLRAIESAAQLEDCLSEPSEVVIDALGRLTGDILILGAGGKMGLSLARMAQRASLAAGVRRKVIAASRFASVGSRGAFEAHGIETVACNLLESDAIDRLPVCQNVVFMAGFKFGTAGREPTTWATNCYLPALVCRRYRESGIVAFSTGNVYGLSPVERGGSCEGDPTQPVGEYAMSCLGRERMFEYFSTVSNIPTVILRLNYACELRYGVLLDLAEKVWSGEPIDLTMGYLNAIWQTDANAMALAAFDHVGSPPTVINLSGELLSVREVCQEFGQLLGKTVDFCNQPADDALLSNGSRVRQWFGPPRYRTFEMLRGIAAWVQRGGERLGKPTHFESRSGKF